MALTWPTLSTNSFTQTVALGMLTFDPQPATIPAQLNPSTSAAAGTVTAGCGLKLIGYSGTGLPIVDVTTSASDGGIFGVVEYSTQKNTYVGGDQLNVAAKGNVIHLWSNAAITRGARVALVNPATTATPPYVQTDTTAGDYTVGVALGQVSAQNQFIKVLVDPGLNQSISGTPFVSVSP